MYEFVRNKFVSVTNASLADAAVTGGTFSKVRLAVRRDRVTRPVYRRPRVRVVRRYWAVRQRELRQRALS